jgi:hypothetical protein
MTVQPVVDRRGARAEEVEFDPVAADVNGRRRRGQAPAASFIDGRTFLDVDVQGRQRAWTCDDDHYNGDHTPRQQAWSAGSEQPLHHHPLARTPEQDERLRLLQQPKRVSNISSSSNDNDGQSSEEWNSSPWTANFGSSSRLIFDKRALLKPHFQDDLETHLDVDRNAPRWRLHPTISFQNLERDEDEPLLLNPSLVSSEHQPSYTSDKSTKSNTSSLDSSSTSPATFSSRLFEKMHRAGDVQGVAAKHPSAASWKRFSMRCLIAHD